ncbi:MAG: O-antigen ligase [Sediminicola sp.]|jgi:O-antigen ligase
MLFYIIHVAGLLYSENIDIGLFSLQKKIPLLIFPLILGSLKQNLLSKQQVNLVITCFVIACAIVSLFNVFDQSVFFIHPTYLGMYIIFATGFLLTLTAKKNIFLVLPFVLLVLATSILLSSRITLIILVLEINAFFIVHSFISKKFIPIIVLILLNIVGIWGVLNYPPTREKFDKLIEFRGDYIRERNWRSNIKVISNHMIMGVGIGDATAELQKARDPTWHEAVFKYNSHNLYLQLFVELGIVGLCVLLFCLIYPTFITLENGNVFYLIFIVSFCLPSLTESTLGLQKGTVYYGFFNSFLFLFGNNAKRVKDYI